MTELSVFWASSLQRIYLEGQAEARHARQQVQRRAQQGRAHDRMQRHVPAPGLRGVAGVIATTAGVVDVDAIVVRRQVDGETLRVTLTAVEMP